MPITNKLHTNHTPI